MCYSGMAVGIYYYNYFEIGGGYGWSCDSIQGGTHWECLLALKLGKESSMYSIHKWLELAIVYCMKTYCPSIRIYLIH